MTGRKRIRNEDRYLSQDSGSAMLLAMADGLGGEAAEGLAADIVCRRA